MLAIGGAAGAASFTHVHNVAAAHGQPGWLAWADAIVLELMSIAAGLELRRGKRAHAPTAFPASVLVCAVTLSLAAQVVEAESSPIGWIAAAVPALGFLVMVKIALGYTTTRSGTGWTDVTPSTTQPVDPAAVQLAGPSIDSTALPTVPDSEVPSPVPVADRSASAWTVHHEAGDEHRPGGPDRHHPSGPVHRRRTSRRGPSAGRTNGSDELLPAARRARDQLAAQEQPLTRAALAAALRTAGHTVSNTRASHLLKTLRDEQPPAARSPQQDQEARDLAADTQPVTTYATVEPDTSPARRVPHLPQGEPTP
ncbi:DUF2637 domain-containing protein [Micromonospora polyrhachis]|nr:DUF2637 domain-containing protein [Micromonospora polyrhachis]